MVIVAGLFIWLRNTLGRNPGDESGRPNPLMRHLEDVKKENAAGERHNSNPEAEGNPAFITDRNVHIQGPDVERGLHEIAAADRNFDLQRFVSGAQDAFVIVVEAFASGDKETLKPLLHESVYRAFDQAISERERKKHRQESEIQSIRQVDIVQARLSQHMAFITLRFTADEVSVTRDAEGNVIAGNPERIFEMKDKWTFGRNVKSRHPAWLVYETNDDAQEEHDSVNIPDAGSTT